MTLTLYHYGPSLGLPDISPFCLKLITYLRLAKISYESEPRSPGKTPRGKLPCVEHEGELIADSSVIIRHLEAHIDAPLDGALSAEERALGRAVQSMIEEHYYFLLLAARWQAPEGWRAYQPPLREVMASLGAPSFLTPLIAWSARRGVIKSLRAQGVGRHSPAENAVTAREIHDAVETLLGDTPYLLGDSPTSFDATLYASLASALVPPIPSPIKDDLASRPALVSYCERVGAAAEAE